MNKADRIIIERIDISAFGGLKNVSLTPCAGVNVITAPNESGKSTVAAFIKYIFYGFGGQRKQSLLENEKSLYMPWDGARAGGGITLSSPQGRFRIERYQSATKESLDIYDAYTRKSVFSGHVPGEVFFGVGEDTFCKMLFFRQLYQSENGDDALAEQVQNIIFSADEKVNTERAVKKLKDLRSSLKNAQKRGMIPRLEQELEGYEEKLSSSVRIRNELENVLTALGEKKQKIAFNETKLAKIEKERENIRKYEARKRLESLLSMARAKQDAEARFDECMEQFEGGDIPDIEFVHSLINDNSALSLTEKRKTELASQLEEENQKLSRAAAEDPFAGKDPEKIASGMKQGRAIAFVLAALCLIAAGAGIALFVSGGNIAPLPVACWSAAAVFAFLAAVFAFKKPASLKECGFSDRAGYEKALAERPLREARMEEARNKIASLEREYAETEDSCAKLKASVGERLARYMSSENGEYDGLLQKMLSISVEAGKLKAEKIALGERLAEQLKDVDIDSLKALAEGAVEPERDPAAVAREYDFYSSASEGLRRQELELEKQRSSLEAGAPSPAVLYGKCEAVKSELSALERRYAALGLALEVLDESREHMRSTVSPKLAELASRHFGPATGGKYDSVSLANDLGMSVVIPGGDKSADFLSAGARDTAYMCLRLALVELLYTRYKPFLVLDDVFSRLDDARLAYMLREIVRYSEEGQVFIMTCHQREGIAAGALTQDIKMLELK